MGRLLFDLFRKSPFGPLHSHMAKVRECMTLLKPLFVAALDEQNETKTEEIVKQISKLEHQADEIKNEIRQTLPSGLFLPVNREDLLAYLKLQDDIADSVEDVSLLLTLKRLTIPKSLHDDLFAFIDKVVEVCHLCGKAEEEFERLVAAAFGEAEKRKVHELAGKAEFAEWEADKAQMALAKRLLAMEQEMSPIDIFLWFRIFGELGRVANHAEKTGDMLRRLLVKA